MEGDQPTDEKDQPHKAEYARDVLPSPVASVRRFQTFPVDLGEVRLATIYAWVYVAAYGGLRWAELAGLKRKRVNLLRRRLHIEETLSDVRGELIWTDTKNNQTRAVALPGIVCDILASQP